MSEAISYEDLTDIAGKVAVDDYWSHYIRLLAQAWVYADEENRHLLFPAWSTIVAKHRMEGMLK